MPFTHACFLSFPREAGKATQFAQEFYAELKETIAVYGKDELPIFKYDQCENRRMGDDWTLWIQRELCQSAMMVAVCAPVYFNGSPGCVSEFDGMELLAQKRCAELSATDTMPNWIIGLRLKSQVALPRLNKGYHVVDFFDCVEEPRNVRRKKCHRQTVEALADRIYQHWQWVKGHPNLAKMHNANICASFQLPNGVTTLPDEFPHAGGVR